MTRPIVVGGGGLTAVYSEIDPHAVGWLCRLADAGHIAPGEVRGDIHGLVAAELVGRPVHLFAGIGGWSLALRLAGIPDDAPIWTGSCPCQPFSQAGKRGGTDDVRHLWPVMRDLVADCLPPVVVGEQVASADGRAWLATVRADLEDLGYAVGAADLCAAGVGAPHIRQRLYWGGVRVGDPRLQRRDWFHPLLRTGEAGRDPTALPEAARRGGAIGLAHTGRVGLRGGGPGTAGGASSGVRGETREQRLRPDARPGGAADVLRLADADRSGPGPRGALDVVDGAGAHADGRGGLGDTDGAGLAGWPRQRGDDGPQRSPAERAGGAPTPTGHAGEAHGGWSDPDWLRCRDGRWRPVESGTFPLAHGVPGRMGLLRGYGNAIVPQVAARFLTALLEAA